tara:strand:+ start:12732 stop:13634 length:903 start_codon:yes stop_codon:yes gene_type:complete
MTKRILITGGSGFIARSLYENLSDRHFFPLESTVKCLNRQQLDILDTKAVHDYLYENNFDVVVHCATYDPVPDFSSKKISRALETNLKMFFNLARCKNLFGRMIYFGSGAVFGRDNWYPKMPESFLQKAMPDDPYGLSKYVMAKYAEEVDNIYNLRVFGLFGKYDDWRYRFISNACCKAVLGEDIIIKQDKRFDYLYIDDLTRIVNWVIESNPVERIYNVCSGTPEYYSNLAKHIIGISGKNLNIDIQTSKVGREYSGDNTLIKAEMKNFSLTPLSRSLREMYDWYDSHKSIIKKELLVY